MTLMPGENVGPYRIVEQLGQGGMATVFKAYHGALDRYVAIKALHPAFKQDPSFLARFEREARIVAKLDHPNIIPIYDSSEHQGIPYLVIRYIEGKTLKTEMRDGLLPLPRVLAIMRPVTEALAHAHSQGVLHRDIKPSNIMIANDGHIYITDFGLARMAQAGESTLTQDMLIGTPQYISPEQAKGEPASERSDIYSLGVVLFELLTGRVPFSADTPFAVIHDHIYTPLPLPSSINPSLSPELGRVLLKALTKDPSARFATATEFMAAISQAARIPEASIAIAVTPQQTPVAATPDSAIAGNNTGGKSPAKPIPPSGKEVSAGGNKSRGIRSLVVGSGAIVVLLFACLFVFAAQRENLIRLFKNAQPVNPAVESVRAARDKVNANPQDPSAHVNLAAALARTKEYEASYAEYDQAIRINPQLAVAYVQAGSLAEQLNDFDRALKYYSSGSKQLNENQDLLLAQADLLLKMKKWEDARLLVEKALRIDANNAAAIWRMGEYYRLQGQNAEATREYTRALAIDPKLPEAHMGLGTLASQRGMYDEARKQFQMVVNNPQAPQELKDQATKQLRSLAGK